MRAGPARAGARVAALLPSAGVCLAPEAGQRYERRHCLCALFGFAHAGAPDRVRQIEREIQANTGYMARGLGLGLGLGRRQLWLAAVLPGPAWMAHALAIGAVHVAVASAVTAASVVDAEAADSDREE